MKQPCKKLLSIALVLGLLLTNLGLPLPKALEPASTQVVYPVVEDAYIRSGSNASKNYNYEGITAAHGQQYVGKGYKVINSKYGPDRSEIIGVMKFDLPTPEEIEQNGLNQFSLAFSIFKNPNPNEGDQSYLFHYTTDNNWSETALTWNNRPSSISRDAQDLLFAFEIPAARNTRQRARKSSGSHGISPKPLQRSCSRGIGRSRCSSRPKRR